VRRAILACKYGGRPFPVRAAAKRLGDALGTSWNDLIPDEARPVIVPVPVHPWKYLRRGFNLTALLGVQLARTVGWPIAPLLLARVRERAPQATLPLAGRQGNVAGAFRIPRGRRAPCCIVLLDDVYTSGATVRAAANALKTGGSTHIVVVTVARAVL
jgi:predicted amidophosphoribosyltransferase